MKEKNTKQLIEYIIAHQTTTVDGIYKLEDMPSVADEMEIESVILDSDIPTISEARKELEKYLSGARVVYVNGTPETHFSRVVILKHTQQKSAETDLTLNFYDCIEAALEDD